MVMDSDRASLTKIINTGPVTVFISRKSLGLPVTQDRQETFLLVRNWDSENTQKMKGRDGESNLSRRLFFFGRRAYKSFCASQTWFSWLLSGPTLKKEKSETASYGQISHSSLSAVIEIIPLISPRLQNDNNSYELLFSSFFRLWATNSDFFPGLEKR